jgi:hypothetical protein
MLTALIIDEAVRYSERNWVGEDFRCPNLAPDQSPKSCNSTLQRSRLVWHRCCAKVCALGSVKLFHVENPSSCTRTFYG